MFDGWHRIVVMSEWHVVEGKVRRWRMLSWHETYWVWEMERDRWLITFGDLVLAGASSFASAIAFAEWHDDFHCSAFEERSNG